MTLLCMYLIMSRCTGKASKCDTVLANIIHPSFECCNCAKCTPQMEELPISAHNLTLLFLTFTSLQFIHQWCQSLQGIVHAIMTNVNSIFHILLKLISISQTITTELKEFVYTEYLQHFCKQNISFWNWRHKLSLLKRNPQGVNLEVQFPCSQFHDLSEQHLSMKHLKILYP